MRSCKMPADGRRRSSWILHAISIAMYVRTVGPGDKTDGSIRLIKWRFRRRDAISVLVARIAIPGLD